MPPGRAVRWKFEFRSSGGADLKRQSSAAAEPSEGAFDDPALGQCDEPCGLIRSLDDLDVDARQNLFHRALELGSLVAAVGIKLDQERKAAEQARHQQRAAVAVLDVR